MADSLCILCGAKGSTNGFDLCKQCVAKVEANATLRAPVAAKKRKWQEISGSSDCQPCTFCGRSTPAHFVKLFANGAVGFVSVLHFCNDDCVDRYKAEVAGW